MANLFDQSYILKHTIVEFTRQLTICIWLDFECSRIS